MRVRVYIAGPMTGYENFNREAFHKAEEETETGRAYRLKPGSTSGRADTAALHGYLHGNDSLCGCDLHAEWLAAVSGR